VLTKIQLRVTKQAPKPTAEPWVMPDLLKGAREANEEFWKKVQQELIEQKMLMPTEAKQPGDTTFEITESGQRFMARYAERHGRGLEK